MSLERTIQRHSLDAYNRAQMGFRPLSPEPLKRKKKPRTASTYRGARHNAAKAEQHKQVLARRAARNANV